MKLSDVRKVLLGTVIPAAAVLGLSACGSSVASNNSQSQAPAAGQTLQMEVLNGELATKFGIVGVDGRGHDSYVPSHITVKAGQTVTISVLNYDEGAHSFTIPELNINGSIKPRVDDNTPSVSTFTVTFSKPGVYRWYCALPCDGGQQGWAMTTDRNGNGPDQNGSMAGYVTVTA